MKVIIFLKRHRHLRLYDGVVCAPVILAPAKEKHIENDFRCVPKKLQSSRNVFWRLVMGASMTTVSLVMTQSSVTSVYKSWGNW